jgi:hypothetical protein
VVRLRLERQRARQPDAYHVVADAAGGGVAVLSARGFALAGQAGAAVRVTATVDTFGNRAVILERTLDETGVLAWSVELRPGDGDGPAKLLRMTRVDCARARALLPDFPACPTQQMTTKSTGASTEPTVPPEVVEHIVYPSPVP